MEVDKSNSNSQASQRCLPKSQHALEARMDQNMVTGTIC